MTLSAASTTASRSDHVVDRLRQSIVSGQIRPNQRLIEVELAAELGVSRTPIREALQRLAAEGLIVSRRRGWVVREHTATEIAEIYEIRAALEGFAARLVAQRASDAEIEVIARLHGEKALRAARSSRDHLVEVNDAFHEGIIAACQNPRLGDLIRRNRNHYFNHNIAVLYSDTEATESLDGHGAIVHALRARDSDAAEAAARAHILEALDVTLSKLR